MSIELTDDERVFFSVCGAIRFDAVAVAEALRNRPLSKFEAHGLANLLDGQHPDGLRLEMVGQGRNWVPIYEGAANYERCMAIGRMTESLRAGGLSWEQSTLDAAEHFGVSEATITRNVGLYRLAQEMEG